MLVMPQSASNQQQSTMMLPSSLSLNQIFRSQQQLSQLSPAQKLQQLSSKPMTPAVAASVQKPQQQPTIAAASPVAARAPAMQIPAKPVSSLSSILARAGASQLQSASFTSSGKPQQMPQLKSIRSKRALEPSSATSSTTVTTVTTAPSINVTTAKPAAAQEPMTVEDEDNFVASFFVDADASDDSVSAASVALSKLIAAPSTAEPVSALSGKSAKVKLSSMMNRTSLKGVMPSTAASSSALSLSALFKRAQPQHQPLTPIQISAAKQASANVVSTAIGNSNASAKLMPARASSLMIAPVSKSQVSIRSKRKPALTSSSQQSDADEPIVMAQSLREPTTASMMKHMPSISNSSSSSNTIISKIAARVPPVIKTPLPAAKPAAATTAPAPAMMPSNLGGIRIKQKSAAA